MRAWCRKRVDGGDAGAMAVERRECALMASAAVASNRRLTLTAAAAGMLVFGQMRRERADGVAMRALRRGACAGVG